MMRLGAILEKARGTDSRVQFARKLGLSYTFVRAMENGLRFPSDKVLLEIAEQLGENPDEMFLAAYCDRSPHLASVLLKRGVSIPEGVEQVEADEEDEDEEVLLARSEKETSAESKSRATNDPF